MNTASPQEEKFKMTFRNSLWQSFLAILCFKPIQAVLAVVLVVGGTSLFGDSDELVRDLFDISNILAFAIVVWLAWYLSKESWLRRQRKEAQVIIAASK